MGISAVLRLMREFQPIRKAIPLFFGNGPFRMAKVLLTALVDLRSANGPIQAAPSQTAPKGFGKSKGPFPFSWNGPFRWSFFYCSRAVKVISVTVGLLNSRPFMG